MRTQEAIRAIISLCSDLAYHNRLHAMRVLAYCVRTGSILGADLSVLAFAALGHDAVFGTVPKGFKSQEHYTAHVVFHVLVDHGAEPWFAWRVYETILSTNASFYPKTLEQKILRAADLHRMADRDAYREDADRLFVESGQHDFREFFFGGLGFLKQFLWPMIELTSRARNQRGASDWHTQVVDNIAQLHRELFDAPFIAEIGPGKNPVLLYRDLPLRSLVVGVEPCFDSRRDGVTMLGAAEKCLGARQLIVPGSMDALPFGAIRPDEIFMANVALRYRDQIDPIEAARASGMVRIVEAFAPADGFGGSVPEAIDWLMALFSKVGYEPSEMRSAQCYPGADSEAFELLLKRG